LCCEGRGGFWREEFKYSQWYSEIPCDFENTFCGVLHLASSDWRQVEQPCL
jgi:hypothetical protein